MRHTLWVKDRAYLVTKGRHPCGSGQGLQNINFKVHDTLGKTGGIRKGEISRVQIGAKGLHNIAHIDLKSMRVEIARYILRVNGFN